MPHSVHSKARARFNHLNVTSSRNRRTRPPRRISMARTDSPRGVCRRLSLPHLLPSPTAKCYLQISYFSYLTKLKHLNQNKFIFTSIKLIFVIIFLTTIIHETSTLLSLPLLSTGILTPPAGAPPVASGTAVLQWPPPPPPPL